MRLFYLYCRGLLTGVLYGRFMLFESRKKHNLLKLKDYSNQYIFWNIL